MKKNGTFNKVRFYGIINFDLVYTGGKINAEQ